MWIPQTEEEIEQVVKTATVSESATLDFKLEVTKKSKDIAKDVAAMANDGGVIIYGIGEDADKRPVVLNPIELAGVPERISAIVRSSIAEPPTINITTIRTKKDQSKGYLVVSIPASPRAPHMVIVGKDYRYYGRSATGNTPLTEGEVSRLYERRKRWEHDFGELLDQVISHAPLQPSNEHGFLHLIAKPLISNDDLLDRASQDLDIYSFFRELVRNARSTDVFADPFSPDFQEHSWRRNTDGWGSYMGAVPNEKLQRDPDDVLDIDINFDGTAYLFCGRAAERMEGGLFIIEVIVAGLTARFLSMMGILYRRANYIGPIDLGIAITGIKGAISYTQNRSVRSSRLGRVMKFDRDEYRRSDRVLSPTLADDPVSVARSLVLPFTRATTNRNFDPFK